MKLDVKLDYESQIPTRANPTDAGLDLRAAQNVWTTSVGERVLVKTGVRVKIPVGHVGLLVARSSLSKKGWTLSNSIGIIDSDYRGELLVSMYKFTTGETISQGERIAQLLIVPIALPTVEVFTGTDEEWVDTQRGTGGFGSSGQ